MNEVTERQRRASIKEIARATGYSRATVDRALNGRGRVHPSTRQQIHAACARLDGTGAAAQCASAPVDMVMQAGRGFADEVLRIVDEDGLPVAPNDLYQQGEAAVHAALAAACADTARPLLAIVKNDAATVKILSAARQRGKRVVAMVSDLDPAARDAFVGIDDRAAGQTAAFLIGSLLRDRDARVGVVVGSASFRCHEDREIGFRTQLRSQAPRLVLSDVVKGDDSPEKTRQAVRALLDAEPDMAAIYNVAGGNVGLAQALREAGRAGDIFVVAHETNRNTVPLAEQGVLHFLLGQDTALMLARALALSTAPALIAAETISHVPCAIFTRFNVKTAATEGQGDD
ncbi:MAG: LacI family DNA-binding transcriptional regulator [Alphaproteobacteria bacterium]